MILARLLSMGSIPIRSTKNWVGTRANRVGTLSLVNKEEQIVRLFVQGATGQPLVIYQCGGSSEVEPLVANEKVVGSIPILRSK